jgi:hypothetical protein
MEKTPIRQLAPFCLALGIVACSLAITTQVVAQEQPRVANRTPLQFGKNSWPSRMSSSTGKTATDGQQPGIFRGGLVQQLRSITSSVLGDSGEGEGEIPSEEGGDTESLSEIPSPPSLKDVVDAPAYSEDGESMSDEEFDDSMVDSPEFETTSEESEPPISSSRPIAPPSMPIPAVPGQSRWRNQTPTPLSDPPTFGQMPSSRSGSRAAPVIPSNANPGSRGNSNATPANVGTGRRVQPNASSRSNVPIPPSSIPSEKRTTQVAKTNEASKPNDSDTMVAPAQPSKTASSRRGASATDKLNSNEITLPTAQVTEIDESRVKLSDRAPASTGNGATAEAAPLVSKKLPPNRTKAVKEPTLNSIPAPTELTSLVPSPPTEDSTKSSTNSTTTQAPSIVASGSPGETSSNSKELKADFGAISSSEGQKVGGEGSTVPQDKSLDMEIPSVLVRLSGPSDIPVGRKGNYELISKNTGSIALNGAIIRMDVPKGVTAEIDEALKSQIEQETLEDGSVAIVWQVAELAPGASLKLPLKLSAAEARNFAIALEWTVMPQNGEMLVNVQKPDLQIGLEGPAEVNYGVPQIYRLKISNPGTAPAENVVLNLSAEPYGSNSSPLGTIAPGSNRVVEVELTFQQKGQLKIKAEAVGDTLNAASEIDVLVRQALLEAVVTGTESEYVGATADYKLELANRGDTASENVIAQVELPEGVKLSQLPAGTRLSGRILLWEINQLNAGQSLTLSWQTELQSSGEKLFQATCRGGSGASAVAQTKTQVEAVADLKLTLADPPSPSPVGEEVVYELEIVNRGKQSANKVKVLAQFSEGIEPSGAVGAEHKIVPGQVLFEPIDTIAAGATVKLQVRALASQAGVHRFRVEVQTDDEEIHHVLEESTRYMQTAARPTGTKLR